MNPVAVGKTNQDMDDCRCEQPKAGLVNRVIAGPIRVGLVQVTRIAVARLGLIKSLCEGSGLPVN